MAPDDLPSTYVVGDVHGELDKLHRVLGASGLIAPEGRWSGGRSTLVFIGDFFDRGPDGVGCVELAMRLQDQARDAGGQVTALLGNHDVLIVSALRFGGGFLISWLRNGGRESDLARLRNTHVDWLLSLPAMVTLGDRLYAHADSCFYCDFGSTVDEVNRSVRALLKGDRERDWDHLLDLFSLRHEFDASARDGEQRARTFLDWYGVRQLIHGHTPIDKVTGQPPETVRQALVYAGGRCVNVDGGMYRGGPGFVYQVPSGSPG
ncbi:MAG: metallophosphoesterase [Chloroflexota bacterium]|nr:metallophosphoesterase [Chloroflexota bacterium]